MPTKKQVMASLEGVLVPDIRRGLVSMNLVQKVAVAKEKVDITLASAALAPAVQELLKVKVEEVVGKVGGVKSVNVSFAEVKPKIEAMIQSMTPRERAHPEIIDHSRRRRIARGSATEPSDINNLIKQFREMKKMLKKMGGGGKLKFRFP